MSREKYFLKLDEKDVLKLPYCSPLTRRIYIALQKKDKEIMEEIFVQRRDAFTIDLVHAINRLKNHEISEIRYSAGVDGFIRIYLDDEGKLEGEYVCKSQSSFNDFKDKLGLAK